MTDRQDRITSLFAEALQQPESDRGAWLDAECAEHPSLAQDVRDLLGALSDAERAGFLSLPSSLGGAPSITERPGTLIGRYKLVELLGEGGFGSVFIAEQQRPVERRVALKIIKWGMDTRQVVARFEQERRALALMDHPNIAKVFDAGATETGRPYFVMELVQGMPITHYCDRHKLVVRDRLLLLLQVCRALQHAHQKGVIHRDIKPRNVLVSGSDGELLAKVIDFGIAKAIEPMQGGITIHTEQRMLIGTPEYMSPEQATGSSDLDTRTDVYGLGVLLYELLTGSTPLQAANLNQAAQDEVQRIIREVDPPQPSTKLLQSSQFIQQIAECRNVAPNALSTQVRGELDWICMKALEKDRTRRYESASALAEDISLHLMGEPVRAAPPTWAYRTRKLVRKHRGVLIAVAAVLLALTAGLVATTTLAFWYHDSTVREAARRTEAEWSSYAANLGLAQSAMALGNWREARARLAECPTEMRGWEWRVLSKQAAGTWADLPEGFIYRTSMSKDGRCVLVEPTRKIRIWDPISSTGRTLVEGSMATGGRFSPDDSHVATFSYSRGFQVWRADGSARSPLIPLQTLQGVSFAPDGSYLLTWDSSSLRMWTLDGKPIGEPLLQVQSNPSGINDPQVSPDGRVLVATGESGSPRLYRLPISAPPIDIPHNTVSWSRFSADSTRLFTVSNDGVKLWNSDGVLLADIPNYPGQPTDHVEFSPDSSRFIVIGLSEVQFWSRDGVPLDGKIHHLGVHTFDADHIDRSSGAEFTADGSHVFTWTNSEVRLWDLQGRAVGKRMRHTNLNSVRASPDGRYLLSCGKHCLRLWDMQGHLLAERCLAGNQMVMARFMPDSRAILVIKSSPNDRTILVQLDHFASAMGRIPLHEARARLGDPQFPKDRTKDSALALQSPDGARRVQYDGQSTIHVHAADNGRALAALPLEDRVIDMGFSADGQILVAALATGECLHWDAREESACEAERRAVESDAAAAAARAAALLAGPHTVDQISLDVCVDQSLSLTQRLATLNAVEGADCDMETESNAKLSELRDSLDIFTPQELAEAVAQHQCDVRTLEMMRNRSAKWEPHPYWYSDRAWNVAKSPGASPQLLAKALAAAREAKRLAPLNRSALFTLGVTLFRAGLTAEALHDLEQAVAVMDATNPSGFLRSDNAGLFSSIIVSHACIAMCHHQLGASNKAHAALARSRDLLKTAKLTPLFATNNRGNSQRVADAFVAEAIALIEDPDSNR